MLHGIGFTFKLSWWWNGRHKRLKIMKAQVLIRNNNIKDAYWNNNLIRDLGSIKYKLICLSNGFISILVIDTSKMY